MRNRLPQFMDLLRCPQTGLKLAPAPASLLDQLRAEHAAGRLLYESGKKVNAPPIAALLREDGKMLYPVCDGIPVLIKEEAIPLQTRTGLTN